MTLGRALFALSARHSVGSLGGVGRALMLSAVLNAPDNKECRRAESVAGPVN